MPAGVDTKTVAKSWIDKDRLPVVNIERNYEKNYLTATQVTHTTEVTRNLPVYLINITFQIGRR